MGDLRLVDHGRGQNTASTATATSQQTLVTGGVANVKGSWVVLLDPTDAPVSGLWLTTGETIATSTFQSGILVDIGIAVTGAGAGTEAVIVPDILFGGHVGWPYVLLPIQVPKGYRISARLQGTTASDTVRMGVHTFGSGFHPADSGQLATNYGAVSSGNSKGADMTVPGATNTKAAWTVLSASTTYAANWLTFCVAGPATGAATSAAGLVDLGVGGAGVEQTILGDLPFTVGTTEEAKAAILTIPCSIPAGSRLVARYQSASTATGARPQVLAILYS